MIKNMNLCTYIASTVEAMNSCNKEWGDIHRNRLDEMIKRLPKGSGFDNGTELLIDECRSDRLVFQFDYHHMNHCGYYTKWTTHKAIVTPAFFEFNLRFTGRLNGLGNYFHDKFFGSLNEPVIDLIERFRRDMDG